MIETLRIENLAIVENEEIEFGPGLNVLTGETAPLQVRLDIRQAIGAKDRLDDRLVATFANDLW